MTPAGECVYCGASADVLDHIRPVSRGGSDHPSNLVPACTPCNASKRAALLTAWASDRVQRAAAVSPLVAAELAFQRRQAPGRTVQQTAPPLQSAKPMLTGPEAAKKLRVHLVTLQRWVTEGIVSPTLRLPGGRFRWDLDDLKRQLAAHEAQD